MAQGLEHLIENQKVIGSIPIFEIHRAVKNTKDYFQLFGNISIYRND